MKKILFVSLSLMAVFFFLGKELNPFDPHFFTFHDNTQAARLQEFSLNLKSAIFPPRLAPNFSFQHGFPVFNFYAPFAYWIGSIFHLIGFPSVLALKMLLFLGLIMSFVSFFLFGSLFFGFWGGILGAIIYSSSLWVAVEIFVRGNVGELWFMALFPLGLYLLKKNDVEKSAKYFLITSAGLSFVFTVHNVLSLISVIFFLLFSLILKHKKKALLSVLIGLLLSSYFLVPALLESRLTYASEIAARTKYADHFLCVWQLWKSDKWSYGGSGKGCLNDDMSFQIGKAQIVLAGVGLSIFLASLRKKGKNGIPFLILGWTLVCAFLTIEQSKPLWDLLSPVMSIFQFPWRFLPFVVFGTAYFAAYIVYILHNIKVRIIVVTLLSLGLLSISGKYFSKPWKYSFDEYSSMYLTQKYIGQKAAYEIPEYFPRIGDYKTWRLYDKSEIGFYTNRFEYKLNTPFHKVFIVDENEITLPIHYFPFWEIKINNMQVIPMYFDKLGRPRFSGLAPRSTISVRYNETPIEKVGNVLSLTAFAALVFFCLNKKIWKKMNSILS